MSANNGVNMALCPTCGALPHEPCVTGWLPDEGRRDRGEWRRRAHTARQRIGGPRGPKRRR